MKGAAKEGESSVVCREHKEKCVFVCLFRSCKEAFKVGCVRCRKEHSQHPNRLISLSDFHPMLGKPIRYLENLTAYKLMNLKKKIEYIRSFRTDILEKETQLMESNRYIKSTISAILEEHYAITDVVSHIDNRTLVSNYDEYALNLQRCKEFLAYNPVKGELVFNNEVIKNSRIVLEKHLKTSHELIDSIRELLVKIIEVLLANCAHDEDDDEIEFAQEGDSATTFNIFIKHRTDVTENPNIKSKLEHSTFLEMFDEEKQAFTKEIHLLQQEIQIKSTILTKIKSHRHQSLPLEINEEEHQEDATDDAIEELRIQNRSLRQQLAQYQSQSSINNHSRSETLHEKKSEQENGHECQAEKLTQTSTSMGEDTGYMAAIDHYKNEIQKYQQQLVKEKEKNAAALRDLEDKMMKDLKEKVEQLSSLGNKVSQLSSLTTKQTNELSALTKKCNGLEQDAAKRKQDDDSQKVTLKLGQEEAARKLNELGGRLAKKDEELQRKQKDVAKEKKKYAQLQKLVERMKDNSASIERESQKWREQYQSREKYMRGELEKSQKELDALKYKSRNEEERNKNIETRMKDLSRELQAKTDMIRQKDRLLREKEQQWQSKVNGQTSRLKQLETELKSSKISDTLTRTYEEQVKKHKQTKDLLEMSIKKGQELKDRIFQLQTELIETKQQDYENFNNSLLNDSNNDTNPPKIEVKPPSNIFYPQEFHIETVNSEEMLQELSKNESPLKERKIGANKSGGNKEDRRIAYLEISSIFKAVSQDMSILEERLKENSVIEKVYLKELERKRNQNKLLKKELQNVKVYGGNFKQPAETLTPVSQTPKLHEKDKKDAKSPSPHANKAQAISGLRKKV